MTPDSIGTFAAQVFGGWPNVMQGLLGSAIGSAVGVYGAYMIAIHTLRGERKARRAEIGGQAAAAIRAAIFDLPTLITQLANVDPQHDYDFDAEYHGLSDWWQKRWRDARTGAEGAINLNSHLLPLDLAGQVSALSLRLKDVLVVDADDDIRVVFAVEPADPSVLAEIGTLAEGALANLTAYIAETLGDRA